jgi:hypothetical protein
MQVSASKKRKMWFANIRLAIDESDIEIIQDTPFESWISMRDESKRLEAIKVILQFQKGIVARREAIDGSLV